jgi:peptide/nickel transport system permease protein
MKWTTKLKFWQNKQRNHSSSIMSNSKLFISLIVIAFIFFGVTIGPMLTEHEPDESNPVDRLNSPSILSESNSDYLLGIDNFGRDLLTRVLYGGRFTLFIGLTATFFGLAVGVPTGMMSGYIGGKLDEAVMRFLDAVMGFPSLLLALLILTMLSPSTLNAILAVSIAFVPRIARVARSNTLSIANEEYVKAAEARGESSYSIVYREILPNLWPPIIIEGTIRIGYAILIASSLSFLGLGPQPPTPEWGVMVADARNHTAGSVWYLLWPSLALALTITMFNILGDELREVLDPRIEERNN